MGRSSHWRVFPFFRLIIFSSLIVGFTHSVRNDSEDWITEFESILNTAAENWLDKDYAKALDGFSSAQIMLKRYMPPPTEVYKWRMCLAFKTYTLVLTRLVETDMHRSEENMERVVQLVEQAEKWVDILKKQAKEWKNVRVKDPDKVSSRDRWLNRFSKAVNHVSRIAKKLNH